MLYQHRKYGLVTPAISLINKGKIDTDAVPALMRFLKESGVKGVFITGSTGYAPMLAFEEHKKLLEQYASNAQKRHLAVFAGIGRNSVEETLSLGRYAIDIGADKLVIVTPYYIKEDQAQLHSYYSKLLANLDSKVLIYNVPSMTGNNIDASTVSRLSKENSNLEGVKSTNSDFDQFQRLIYYTEKDFLVFQGYDHLLLPSLEIGASGGVCGTTNFTSLAVKLYEAYNSKNTVKSIELHRKLSDVYHALEQYEFPGIYNSMFYKLIMRRTVDTEPDASSDLSAKEIGNAARKLQSIIKS